MLGSAVSGLAFCGPTFFWKVLVLHFPFICRSCIFSAPTYSMLLLLCVFIYVYCRTAYYTLYGQYSTHLCCVVDDCWDSSLCYINISHQHGMSASLLTVMCVIDISTLYSSTRFEKFQKFGKISVGAPSSQPPLWKWFLYMVWVLVDNYLHFRFDLPSSINYKDINGFSKLRHRTLISGHPRGSKVVPLDSTCTGMISWIPINR